MRIALDTNVNTTAMKKTVQAANAEAEVDLISALSEVRSGYAIGHYLLV